MNALLAFSLNKEEILVRPFSERERKLSEETQGFTPLWLFMMVDPRSIHHHAVPIEPCSLD